MKRHPTRGGGACAAQSRGFTLLELLVATALLSLVMLGLSSAIRTIGQTESRVDRRLDRITELHAKREFVQETFSRASAAAAPVPGAPGETSVPFVAGANEIIWAGNLPARPNVGGRHFFRLALEGNPPDAQLVLRIQPWQTLAYPQDWSTSEARVLASGVKAFIVRAKGLPPAAFVAESRGTDWSVGWPQRRFLPEQLHIEVEDRDGPWPLWVFPVRASASSDTAVATTVIGGSR